MVEDIIRSLSPAEKGYFKKWASSGFNEKSTTAYLELFKKLETKNHTVTLTQKGDTNKDSVAKNYLSAILLDALSQFHKENIPINTLLKHFRNFHLVATRGLIEDAEKQLNKALQFSLENELFHYALEAIHLKRKLWLQINTADKQVEELEMLNETYENVINRWGEFRQMEELLFKQAVLMQPSYTVRNKSLKELHTEIMQHPFLAENISPTSLRARHYGSCVRLNFYAISNQREQAVVEAEKLLQLCKTTSYFLNCDNLSLINAYNQVLTAYYFGGKTELMEDVLLEFNQIKLSNKQAELYRFLYYSMFQLVLLDSKKDKTAVEKLSIDAEKQMLSFLTFIRSDLFLALVTAFSSAMLEYGYYGKAIKWIEIYKQNLKVKKHFDTQTTLQVFQMIAHYKKGNVDLLESMLGSLERFVSKNQGDAFDYTIIKLFKAMLYRPEKTDFTLLKNELEENFKQNPNGKNRNLMPLLELVFSNN